VDIPKLLDGTLLPGAFLNAKGRILHDILVSRRTNQQDASVSFDMEVHKDCCEGLISMLRRYKLRKKVTIDLDATRRVFAVWQPTDQPKEGQNEQWFADPRPGHALGSRVWTAGAATPSVASGYRTVDESVYHQIRMATGLAEGPEECAEELPFVLNFDWWPKTLAFDKGCYTGQELIARTHFKGQVRKRIVPVLLSTENGQSVKEEPLLPSFASSWKLSPTSKKLPPLKCSIEPIAGTSSAVGEGSLLAIAPGGRHQLGLAAFRDFESVRVPGKEFQPTHQIQLEGGDVVKVQPIRPKWWPAEESI